MNPLQSSSGQGGATIVTMTRGGSSSESPERSLPTVVTVAGSAELNNSVGGGAVTIAGGGGANQIGLTGVDGTGSGNNSIAFTESEGNIIRTYIIDSATLGSLGGAGNITVVADNDQALGSHFLTSNDGSAGGISLAKLTSNGGIQLGGPADHITVISGGNDINSSGSGKSNWTVLRVQLEFPTLKVQLDSIAATDIAIVTVTIIATATATATATIDMLFLFLFLCALIK